MANLVVAELRGVLVRGEGQFLKNFEGWWS